MRSIQALRTSVLLFAACGGSPAKTTTANEAPPPDVRDDDDESETEEPPAPERRVTYARAALTPVKGTKLKPSLVTFVQRDGEDTIVELDTLDGAKPGAYLLIVHAGSECGTNAAKAGAVWPAAKDPLRVEVSKDLIGTLERSAVDFSLRGDDGAIGHVVVLREEKKGKPGKALACGVIEEVDDVGDEAP